MEFFLLPENSYFDEEGMLRNEKGVLLPDGIYKNGDEEILYEGIFNTTMNWDSSTVKKIDEPILNIDELATC